MRNHSFFFWEFHHPVSACGGWVIFKCSLSKPAIDRISLWTAWLYYWWDAQKQNHWLKCFKNRMLDLYLIFVFVWLVFDGYLDMLQMFNTYKTYNWEGVSNKLFLFPKLAYFGLFHHFPEEKISNLFGQASGGDPHPLGQTDRIIFFFFLFTSSLS